MSEQLRHDPLKIGFTSQWKVVQDLRHFITWMGRKKFTFGSLHCFLQLAPGSPAFPPLSCRVAHIQVDLGNPEIDLEFKLNCIKEFFEEFPAVSLPSSCL